jgi:hypothetical protein
MAQMTPASAHLIYGDPVVAQGQGFCARGYAEIGHGWEDDGQVGNGRAKVGIATNSDGPSSLPCYWRKPAWIFQQAILGVIYYYDWGYAQWYPCFGSEWVIRSDSQQLNRQWDGLAYECGDTAYATLGYAYGRGSSNAEWIGNGFWSQRGDGTWYHYAVRGTI